MRCQLKGEKVEMHVMSHAPVLKETIPWPVALTSVDTYLKILSLLLLCQSRAHLLKEECTGSVGFVCKNEY